MDHQPLHLDSEAEVFLFQLCVHGILVLPLHTLVLLSLTKIYGGWLVHVVLPLVVSEHHLTVKLQLQVKGEKSQIGSERVCECLRVGVGGCVRACSSTHT